MKSHGGNVLHMYEGPMQSSFMERFVRGMKLRMPVDSDRDKLVNSKIVNSILDRFEYEWSDPDTLPDRSRELLMAAGYICVVYDYSLQGYEGF